MTEFILLSLPSAVYFLIYGRRKRCGYRVAAQRLGAVWGHTSAYLWALVLLVPLAGLGYLALATIPAETLSAPGMTVASVSSVGAALGVLLRAVGEEVFFRGLVGGVLVRRLGFRWGNLLQSAVFLVPHLPLLILDTALWPILPVQFVTGWLLGWLRTQTGTFVPGSILHAIVNTGAGLIAF